MVSDRSVSWGGGGREKCNPTRDTCKGGFGLFFFLLEGWGFGGRGGDQRKGLWGGGGAGKVSTNPGHMARLDLVCL